MAHTPETLAARSAMNARMKKLPYAKRVKLTEALRAIDNDGRAFQAENARRAAMPPAQPNAMSDAVAQRLSPEPPPTPKSLYDIKPVPRKPVRITDIPGIASKIREEKSQQAAARTMTERYAREQFGRPNFPPTENPVLYPQENLAQRLGGRISAGAERVAEKVIPLTERIGANAGRITGRALGKIAPVIGDLILPYASITGGEMYPQSEDGIYSSAVGGPLPPQYAAANEQEMQRRIPIENLAAQQAQARTQYGLEGPMQLNPVPLRTNIAASLPQQQRDPFVPLEMQQPQEPQSFAQRLSQEPAGEFEHYVKIYGSPERARQAMAQKYQAQQPNY